MECDHTSRQVELIMCCDNMSAIVWNETELTSNYTIIFENLKKNLSSVLCDQININNNNVVE